MNASLPCIVLLACVVTCFCSTTIKRCQCITKSKGIDPKLIAGVKVYNPRPHCKNTEVIVRLKDNNYSCLDTGAKFTQDLLKAIANQKASQAKQQKTSVLESTTATAIGSNTIVV